jgi:hypothetical protein
VRLVLDDRKRGHEVMRFENKTTIYYTGVDGGDGSVSVSFYESQECIDLLEERDPEYHRGEGGGQFTVTGEIEGLEIETLEDVKDYLRDMDLLS